jgi:hypothetical protein
MLAKDQNAAHPPAEIVDPGSPLGDPVKFVHRQKVLGDDGIDKITRTLCEMVISTGSRVDKAKDSKGPFDAAKADAPKKPGKKEDKNEVMLTALAKDKTTLGSVTARELQIACGEGESKDVYFGQAIASKSETVLGQTFLIDRLSTPTTDLAILGRRQNAIRALYTDGAHQDAIYSALLKMKRNEGPLLSFWNKVQPPNCVGKLSFQSLPEKARNAANKSPLFREAIAQYETFNTWMGLATKTVAGAALTAYGTMTMGLLPQNPALADFAERYSGSANVIAPSLFSLATPIQTVAATGMGVGVLSTIPNTYRWLLADRGIANLYFEKMVNIAHFMDGASRVYEAACSNDALKTNLEHFAALEQFFKDPELKPLFESLEKLGPKAGYFQKFMWNPMLISMQLFQEKPIRNKIEKALVALAEIDTVFACVRLLQSDETTPYSLANYSDSKTPEFRAEGLFNPQIKKPTLNDISLSSKHNEVITGPNGGGKSTFTRAALDAALMAQTLTITPARSVTLTPFDDIRSALNTHDTVGGSSHFQAQVQRMTLFAQDAEANPTKRYFLGIDEPFNGASAENADAFSNALLARLGDLPNCLSIVATHDQLKDEYLKGWSFTQMTYHHETGAPFYSRVSGKFNNPDLALKVAQHIGCDAAMLKTAAAFKAQQQ